MQAYLELNQIIVKAWTSYSFQESAFYVVHAQLHATPAEQKTARLRQEWTGRLRLLRIQLFANAPEFHEIQCRNGAKNGREQDQRNLIHCAGYPSPWSELA